MTPRTDKELVDQAWVTVQNDPEYFSRWQNEFIEDLQIRFTKGEQKWLSDKQESQVRRILEDRDD